MHRIAPLGIVAALAALEAAGRRIELPRAAARGYRLPAAPPRAGRNEPCPCGSGRKFKKCCLGKEGPCAA